MRSIEKHVLLVRHTHGKGTATYPVSVHANAKTAALHKARLAGAVKQGQKDAAVALAPKLRLTETGDLPTDVKYSVVALPYEPEAPASETGEDTFDV